MAYKGFELRFRLDRIFKERALSQRQAALMCDIHPNVMYKMFNNDKSAVGLGVLLRLCIGLGISLDQLFEIDAVDENNPIDAKKAGQGD